MEKLRGICVKNFQFSGGYILREKKEKDIWGEYDRIRAVFKK